MSKESLKYFKGDELAASVWQSKYAVDGESTPDDMHRRMAKEFARVESEYIKNEKKSVKFCNEVDISKYGLEREDLTEGRIYELFKDFKYVIPQGSIMATLGTDQIASLSNCWVVESPLDSYASIHKADGDLIYYYKRRGGVGVDISNLRPANTKTNNAAKTSTGAVSFMHRFSNTTREVAMNGRRGALMISIDINHPDVMDFIKVKRDGTSVTGANISIKLNKEFMKAVENDEDYILRFPCDSTINFNTDELEYNKLLPLWSCKDKSEQIGYIKKIKAKEYWDEIVKSARDYAEPGLMYWDNALEYDPAGVYEQYKPISTNPCAEQFLQANDSCRLMVHNLVSYVDNPFTDKAKFNVEMFYKNAYECARLGDDLVDLEAEYIQRIIDKIKSDPEPDHIKRQELELWKKSKEICLQGRRVGIGITALGDTLASLGIKYDSDEGLDMIEQIMQVKMKAELDCTIDLAITRGAFNEWDKEKEFYNIGDEEFMCGQNKFYDSMLEEFPDQVLRMIKYGRRNISWSTIAPTGSVSLLAGNCTSGCEPLFQPFYMRRKKINTGEAGVRVDFVDEVGDSWQEFPVLHPKFKEWIQLNSTELLALNGEVDFNLLDKNLLQLLFEKSPWYKSTANDIDWKKRVEIQAVLQKYTTNAISSTINLPSTVTYEEVSDIYMYGWKKGLKGQTVYVDGSRSGVLVTENKKELVTFNENHAPKRPKSLACKVVRFNNNYEKWIAFVGLLDNKPYEIFTGKAENVDLPATIESGEIRKVKDESGKRYDFIYEGGRIERISTVSSSDYWNYGKLISGMLRHGMPLPYVVDTIQSLNWDSDHINTWKAGVSRALKKFIKDGKAVGFTCNDCGSEQVVFQEGCLRCNNCGSSKCG